VSVINSLLRNRICCVGECFGRVVYNFGSSFIYIRLRQSTENAPFLLTFRYIRNSRFTVPGVWHSTLTAILLGAFASCDKATLIFVASVGLHRTALLPPDGYSWNSIFDNFSKIWLESSSLIENWQEWRVHYMKTSIHFASYLAHLCLKREMFQTKVVENIKTHISCSMIFYSENRAVYEIIWKNIVDSLVTPDNVIGAHAFFILGN
jgi:hypothetical protein